MINKISSMIIVKVFLTQVQHRLNIMLKECLEASEAGEDMAEIAVKELGTLKTGGSKRVAAKRKQQGSLHSFFFLCPKLRKKIEGAYCFWLVHLCVNSEIFKSFIFRETSRQIAKSLCR